MRDVNEKHEIYEEGLGNKEIKVVDRIEGGMGFLVQKYSRHLVNIIRIFLAAQ